MWIRTCQECGHEQEDYNPNAKQMSPAMLNTYQDRRCKKCRSAGLDWGKEKLSQDDSSRLE